MTNLLILYLYRQKWLLQFLWQLLNLFYYYFSNKIHSLSHFWFFRWKLVRLSGHRRDISDNFHRPGDFLSSSAWFLYCVSSHLGYLWCHDWLRQQGLPLIQANLLITTYHLLTDSLTMGHVTRVKIADSTFIPLIGLVLGSELICEGAENIRLTADLGLIR